MSILLQCRRVFPHPWFRKVNTGLIVFVFIFFVWTSCNTIFACLPVHYFWNRTVDPNAKGKCLAQEAIWCVRVLEVLTMSASLTAVVVQVQ